MTSTNESYGDNVYLASIYRLTGANFRHSAEILGSALEWDEHGRPKCLTAIPFYFLISHAAELFLKAALLKRGFSEDDLKKYDYRHNLEQLLEELQKTGVTMSTNTVDMIHGLHRQHQTHALRYTALVDDGTKTFMPPPALIFSMIDELLLLTRLSGNSVRKTI